MRLGLALGSGAARGFSHIGVLMALDKHRIHPDYISGTSIGAAIGALYCSGMSPKEMREFALNTDWESMIDFTVPKSGMISGHRIERLMQELTRNCSFSDLRIPLSIIAADVRNSQKVVFQSGNVAKAVRASISVPGVFKPVKIDNHLLVDGGIVDPLPVSALEAMGADRTIGVDLSIDFKSIYIHGSRVTSELSFYEKMKTHFIESQVSHFKQFLIKRKRLPEFTRRYLSRAVDTFLNPARMYGYVKGRKIPEIVRITIQSMLIMQSEIYKSELKDLDVVVRPELPGPSLLSFEDIASTIESGYKACEARMPAIRALLRDKK
jgi:predicted acylesterase/phospholipase RssA